MKLTLIKSDSWSKTVSVQNPSLKALSDAKIKNLIDMEKARLSRLRKELDEAKDGINELRDILASRKEADYAEACED